MFVCPKAFHFWAWTTETHAGTQFCLFLCERCSWGKKLHTTTKPPTEMCKWLANTMVDCREEWRGKGCMPSHLVRWSVICKQNLIVCTNVSQKRTHGGLKCVCLHTSGRWAPSPNNRPTPNMRLCCRLCLFIIIIAGTIAVWLVSDVCMKCAQQHCVNQLVSVLVRKSAWVFTQTGPRRGHYFIHGRWRKKKPYNNIRFDDSFVQSFFFLVNINTVREWEGRERERPPCNYVLSIWQIWPSEEPHRKSRKNLEIFKVYYNIV